MTKINLIAVLISILFQLNANAETMCQTITPDSDNDKYSVEILPSDKENIILVKFTVPEDCYVSIKVTDSAGNLIQELVKDEIPAGSYNVYHNTSEMIFNGKDKCTMEIYKTHDDSKEAVYTKEIILSAK